MLEMTIGKSSLWGCRGRRGLNGLAGGVLASGRRCRAGWAWVPVLLLLAVVGCGERSERSGPVPGQPYSVVATTGMIADVVREVAGDRANVRMLVPSGGDPHSFVPTRSDVRALMDADVVFYNGLMLEGRMADTLASLAKRGRTAVAVAEQLPVDRRLMDEEDEEEYDPHLWMDVGLWSLAVDVIVQTLSAFDPNSAAEYRERGEAYQQRLAALDEYVRGVIATIPESQRLLLTAHDAFGYFGRAYNIEVMGIQGISTESEAGIRRIEELVDLVVARRVPAVFPETSVAEDHVEAIRQGAADRGWSMILGPSLFSDAMGREGTYEGTYIGMIDHNATKITRALGGEAPERGMQGLLRDGSRWER